MSDKTDNPGIYAMLEEIKEEQKRARTAKPAQVAQAVPDLTPVTAKLNEHLGPMAAKINSTVKGMSDTATNIGASATKIETSAENIDDQMESLADGIAQVQSATENLPTAIGKAITETIQQQIPLEVKYRHAIDFRSGKALLWVAVAIIVAIIEGYIIYHLTDALNQRADNDLKYRHIKMHGSATADDIGRLQDIFDYNRDEATIRTLRQTVEQYEQAVAEQARRIEQARLNAIRAEQLRQEITTIKSRK